MSDDGNKLLRAIARMEKDLRDLKKMAQEVVGSTLADEIIRLHKQGLTVRQIADRTGKAYQTVYSRIMRESLTPLVEHSPREWGEDEEKRLMALVAQKGYLWQEIAAELKRNPSGVQSRYYLVRSRQKS